MESFLQPHSVSAFNLFSPSCISIYYLSYPNLYISYEFDKYYLVGILRHIEQAF
jgi:hypothetical protein